MDRVAQWVLLEMYQATILAAVYVAKTYRDRNLPGRNKCFLTLVGGGVFQNEHEWIATAITQFKDLMVMSGLQVYLVCFSRGDFDMQGRLKGLVEETGGGIINSSPSF
jgi:hypothetical protein